MKPNDKLCTLTVKLAKLVQYPTPTSLKFSILVGMHYKSSAQLMTFEGMT